MYKSCITNGVNTATFIKVTYVEAPSAPAIPATAAADENPVQPLQ